MCIRADVLQGWQITASSSATRQTAWAPIRLPLPRDSPSSPLHVHPTAWTQKHHVVHEKIMKACLDMQTPAHLGLPEPALQRRPGRP